MFSFQFVTTVVSCCPAELKQEVDGKTEILKGFNVKLQDTILFPEGGGQVWAENPYLSTPCYSLRGPGKYLTGLVGLFQPDDHGVIGDVPVLRVTRQGPEAVHFVTSPLEEGQEVKVKVDWVRRFDHMQQHSGECRRQETYINVNLLNALSLSSQVNI